ncbi:hypothetical protein Tco_1187813 [Tanacetum coccineum]
MGISWIASVYMECSGVGMDGSNGFWLVVAGIELEKRREACSFMLCDLDFEPLSLSLTSMPSCDLESLTNILILCLILKASNQSYRKSLTLNLELS